MGVVLGLASGLLGDCGSRTCRLGHTVVELSNHYRFLQ